LELLSSINPVSSIVPSSSLTIGTFDGMHIGHNYLIREMLRFSKDNNLPSVVVTFSPNPFIVLNNLNKSQYHLMNRRQKYSSLESMGVDYVYELDFDKEMSEMGAEDFLRKYILSPFNPNHITIGYDHHFGRGREGDSHFLASHKDKNNYTLNVVDAYKLDDETVSSSLIRSLIKDGSVATASKYLGYNYEISGEVVKGNSVGREIGFPTANIDIDALEQLIPKNGVYFIKAKINEDNYSGMCNIGHRPTISDENMTSIEVHIFNYTNFDLYNQIIDIEFVDYVRSEIKFENIEDLKLQLIKDKEYCEDLQF